MCLVWALNFRLLVVCYCCGLVDVCVVVVMLLGGFVLLDFGVWCLVVVYGVWLFARGCSLVFLIAACRFA